MYEAQRKRLQEYGLDQCSIDRAVAILSQNDLEAASLANGKIGGAGYGQVISLFFQKLLSQREYVERAIEEFSGEPLTKPQISKWMSDPRGSWGNAFVIDEIELNLEERIRIETKMALFKHYLLQEYFGFSNE